MVALLYRVVIESPGLSGLGADLITPKVGAFVALAAAIALTYGGYRSMREEGISERDGPGEIETIRLSDLGRS